MIKSVERCRAKQRTGGLRSSSKRAVNLQANYFKAGASGHHRCSPFLNQVPAEVSIV